MAWYKGMIQQAYTYPAFKAILRTFSFVQSKQRHNTTLAALVALLLPNFDALDQQLASLLPSRIPLITSIPELLLSFRIKVDPGLAISPILEPAVRASDSNVQDQVEVLVERRVGDRSSSLLSRQVVGDYVRSIEKPVSGILGRRVPRRQGKYAVAL